MRQKERDAHQGVAAVVEFGVDDAAVALAADDGVLGFHFGHHVHLAHRARTVGRAVAGRYIAQGTGRGQIAHAVAGTLGQQVIGHRDQRVFFAKEFAILTDQDQAVHIGIDHDTEVAFFGGHQGADVVQMLAEGFGIVREAAMGLAEEQFLAFDAQGIQQGGHGNATGGIDRIHGHGEARSRNRSHVHVLKV